MPEEITDAKVINSNNELKVVLPLTKSTSKIRVKTRTFFGDYGVPVAARQIKLGLSNYVEWQIGYDLEANPENYQKTSLKDKTFIDYKNRRKYSYELSEILFYSFNRGLLNQEDITNTYKDIMSVQEERTLEKREDMQICRTNPLREVVNGVEFYRMTVKYPMLVYKFGQYDIYAEVIIKEKQRAVGTQAMLYVCLPITKLRFSKNIIGRTLEKKETADWIIGTDEAVLSLKLFRIFGMLSSSHRADVLAIFRMLFPFIAEIP